MRFIFKGDNTMKQVMKIITLLIFCLSCCSFAGPGLADGATKFVGNITQSNTAPGPNDEFTKLWNQATAENGCKWGSVEGTRGNYNWSGCDAAYNWAKNNGGLFKFHALLWGSQYPNWLPGLSVDETKKAITAWFDAVKKHYPSIDLIDVANEAIRTNTGYHSNYKNTKIIEALGGDNNQSYQFLITAFQMARERWPDAILIYNDYNTIQWDVDGGIKLIQTLQEAKAPIDGYGLQGHDLMSTGGNYNGTGGGGTCMDYNQFVSTMEKIHKQTNNIPIFISEYDVPSTDDNIQERCYKEQFSYWMEDPYVAGITIWGYIYGHTWLDCNGTASGCSGLIKNGQDRKAMTWLKSYLSTNKGINVTGLGGGIVIEPVPQEPFKSLTIPGKIELEDFDIPGVGKDNDSYYDADTKNQGNSTYRKDTGVDLYDKATGVVVGYIEKDEWLEYTVNVTETGTYTMFAAVASDGGGAFKLSIDGKDITDSVIVPKAQKAEGDTAQNFDDFYKAEAEINLTKGIHVLRFTALTSWFDIDYMNFVVKGEPDPEPIIKSSSSSDLSSSSDETVSIYRNIEYSTLHHFEVFDLMGHWLGRVSAYSTNAAHETVQLKYSKGHYILK